MDWIKSQYDRLALAVLGLLAMASAVVIIMQALSFPETFLGQDSSKPPNDTLPQPPTETIVTEISALQQPAEWTPTSSSLLVSKPYILKDGILINPLQGGAPLHPPIPNEWIIKYELDYADMQLLQADMDGDLFTVLEEFLAETDPTDPKSKPSYATKLRVRQFISERFRLKFSSIVDSETFSVNTIDLNEPTTFIKVGQFIPDTKFKLTKFERKTLEERGIVKDVSELVFENMETGDTIILPLDQVVDSPTPIGVFVNLLDGQEFRVRRNGEFSLSQDPDVKYKLIDITDSGAVIQRTDTGKELQIPAETP